MRKSALYPNPGNSHKYQTKNTLFVLPEERMEKRFPFMAALYDLSEGDVRKNVKFRDIIEKAGLTELEGNHVGRDLFDLGFRWQPMNVWDHMRSSEPIGPDPARKEWGKKEPVRLTIRGKFEFENEYLKRKKGTPASHPTVNNYYFKDNAIVNSPMTKANVQQGKNSTQSLSTNQINDLHEILEDLRQICRDDSLPVEARQEITAEIDSIESHTKRGRHDIGFIAGKFGTIVRIMTKLEPLFLSPTVIDRIQNWIASIKF